MPINFSEEELEEIKEMVEFAFNCSIMGKELTYSENIENLITNPDTKNLLSVETLHDYIEQLNLEKKSFWAAGVDEMPLTDKLILFLEEIIEEKSRT